MHWVSLAYDVTTLVLWPTFTLLAFLLFTGRNRKLQGLAVSIVKLWEKCEIAKVAVKRGVQNTNSELMAEELKVGIFLQCTYLLELEYIMAIASLKMYSVAEADWRNSDCSG